MKLTITVDQFAIARRRLADDDKRDAMRDGVVRRAQTFRAKKGRGSYRRTAKHREF